MKKQHCTRFLCALLSALLLVFPLAGCANQAKKEPRVTCRQSIVPAMQSETLLEFEAQGIRFDPKMTSEVLVPLGSFAGRRVEIVSAEKRKLSLRLYGEIQKDGAAGAYLDGGIQFCKGAFADAQTELFASVGVAAPGIYTDAASLSVSAEQTRFSLVFTGYVLADEIGMDAVQIADTELIGVQRESDTAISITVKGGAANKNEAAARLNRKILTLSAAALGVKEEVRASLDFEQAAFFVDFDYAQIENEELLLTFLLTLQSGSFSDGFSAQQITLTQDLAGAQIRSATLQDGTVTVLAAMPAQTTLDRLSLSVGFTISKEAIQSRWGENPAEDADFSRHITQDDMGRYSGLDFYDDLSSFCSIVQGSGITQVLSVAFPPAGAAVNLVFGAITTMHGLMDLFGVLDRGDPGPSDLEIICEKFDSISRQLDVQNQKLNQMFKELKEVEKNQLRAEVDAFNANIKELSLAAATIDNYYKYATEKLVDQSKTPAKSLDGITEKILSGYREGMSDEEMRALLTEEEQALLDEWITYCNLLVEAMETEAQKGGLRNSFSGFYKSVDKLEAALQKVCVQLTSASESPFDRYDQLCVYSYNFDKASFPARSAYRAIARSTVDHAMILLMQLYGASDPTIDHTYIESIAKQYYAPALSAIARKEISLTTGDEYRDGIEANKAVCYVAPAPRVAFEKTWFAQGTSKREVEKFFETMKTRLFWNNLSDAEKQAFKERMKLRGLTGDTVISADAVYKEYALLGRSMIIDGKVGIDDSNFVITGYDDFEIGEEYNGYAVKMKNVTYVYLKTGDITVDSELKFYCDPTSTFGFYLLVFDGTSRMVN